MATRGGYKGLTEGGCSRGYKGRGLGGYRGLQEGGGGGGGRLQEGGCSVIELLKKGRKCRSLRDALIQIPLKPYNISMTPLGACEQLPGMQLSLSTVHSGVSIFLMNVRHYKVTDA